VKRFWRVLALTVVLLIFWVILTATGTWFNLITGVAVSVILAVVISYMIPKEYESHLKPGFVLRLPLFFVLLFWEIVKANWDVFKRVMAPSLPISPKVVQFDSVLESDTAKTVLAGSINLTPGTVTLEIDDARFTVHCLAGEVAEDLMGGRLERMVAWLFAEGPPETRRLK